MPVATCDLTLPDAYQRQTPNLPIDDTNPYRFNVFFALPRPTDLAFLHNRDLRSGRYNITFRPWEFLEIPETWSIRLRDYEEIWVPSTFILPAFTSKVRQSVVCIPHPVPPHPLDSQRRSTHLAPIPAGATVFLFVYNYTRASHGRKNPEGLIAAFKQAFAATENAWLVIKAGFLNERHVRRELERMASERRCFSSKTGSQARTSTP